MEFTCIVIFPDFVFVCVCMCLCMLVCARTRTLLCVGTHMRLPQGLRSCAPSVALRGLKPICLSAAQNADRQSSTRLTQCWDWNGGGEWGGGAAGGAEAMPNGV